MGAPNGGMEEKKKMVEDYVHGSSLYHFSCGAIPRMEGLVVELIKHVTYKIDWRLVPFLAVLYLMAYLDRANIANAKIEGMLEDLGMSGVQYNIAVSLFFIPYIIFGEYLSIA